MPDFLTHQAFGEKVWRELPEELRTRFEPDKQGWKAALYGPDPLFYHRWPLQNAVTEEGHRMHRHSPEPMLKRLFHHRTHRYAATYAAGLLCHYALDSACHPTVLGIVGRNVVTHTLLEGALDRTFLRGDVQRPDGCPVDHTVYRVMAAACEIATEAQCRAAMERFITLSVIAAELRRIPLIHPYAGTVETLRHILDDSVQPCAESVRMLLEGFESGIYPAFAFRVDFNGKQINFI